MYIDFTFINTKTKKPILCFIMFKKSLESMQCKKLTKVKETIELY